MISWIQHHLIRHGRWIFLTLLALIIVAFVFTIGATPGCTTDSSGYEENLFYGIDLNSPRKSEVIIEKVQLSAILNGQEIRSDEQFQNQLASRIALLHLAEEMGVPSPNQKTLSEYITTKAAFLGANGKFSADAYTSFVDSMESNPRMSQGLLIVVLEEDYLINQISSVLSGPGYLLPAEAISQTKRRATKLDLTTAELNYADFIPDINVEETALREYYEANKIRYEIPERVKASYVYFDVEAYVEKVSEPSEAELREHFKSNQDGFVADYELTKPARSVASGEEETPKDEKMVTFSDVREAVTQSYLIEQKTRMANEAAQGFAYTLYLDEIKRDSAAFKALLNKGNLSLTKLKPYTLAETNQRALSSELLESAFKLGGNRYYSAAYAVDSGFAVLIYEGRIVSEIPEFEAVQSKLTNDYKTDKKRSLFNEKGESLQAELKAKIAEGIDFAEAAESLGLDPASFETVSVKEAPRDLNRSALQIAQGMQSGDISPMLTSNDKGILVYVANKTVPEIASDNEDLAQAEDFLARFSAYTSGAAFANELVFLGLPEEAAEELTE